MQRRRQGRIRTPGVSALVHRHDEVQTQVPVENLSMGGAYLRTPRPYPVGTCVGVTLVVPRNPHPIPISGRVVSGFRESGGAPVPAGMGVAFAPPAPEVAARLYDLLMEFAPGPRVLEGDPVQPRPAPSPRTVPGAARIPLPSTPLASAKLAIQIKWLLLELRDWRTQAAELEQRNASLQRQLSALVGEPPA